MATIAEAKRRLTIEHRSEGADKARADLQAVSGGMEKAAAAGVKLEQATDGVTSAQRRQQTTTQSVERSLNAIQRRYDEVYRSEQAMARVERDLASAQSQGLITLSRRMELLSLAAQRHDLASSAIRRQDDALKRLSTTERMAANSNVRGPSTFNTANIAAQFQDVGVTAAMGMNPIQIALQQGTQLSAVLEQIRGSGQSVGRTLLAAFTSLINPLSLITIGLTAGAAAAIQYFMSTSSETDKANETLKAHGELIGRIKDRYGEAAAGLQAYSKESAFILKADIARARESYEAMVAAGAQAASRFLGSFTATDVGPQTPLFRPIQQALAELDQGLATGHPNLKRFADQLARLEVSPYATDSQKAMIRSLRDLDEVASGMQAQRALGGLDTLFNDVGSAAVENAKAINRFTEALERLSKIGVNDTPAMSALRDAIAAAEGPFQRQEALRQYDAAVERERKAKERAEADKAASRVVPQLRGIDDMPGWVDWYDKLNKSGMERVRQLDAETQALGMTAGQAARFKYEQDAIADAMRNNIELTPDMIAGIRGIGAEMEQAANRAARAKLLFDLQFERDQLGRSGLEATVAGRLRSAGQPVDPNSELAGLIRANELLKQQVDIWNDVRSTGMDAVDQIVGSASRGFKDIGDVAKGIWQDIAKQALTLGAANPIKNALFGTSLPTMANLGGEGGFFATLLGMTSNPAANASKIPGLGQAVSSMNVTATVVNLSGGGLPGLGDISRLLPGANDNSAVGALTKLASGGGGGSMSLWKQAISAIESGSFGGNYSALGPITKNGDRAYGRYQVMGNNIPSWTMGALGQRLSPQQFLGNPAAQDAVFEKYFGASVNKYGSASQAASVWFTGRPISASSAAAADVTGTTGSKYVDMFNSHLRKLGAASDQATKGIQNLGQGAGNLGSAFAQGAQSGGSGGGIFQALLGGLNMAFSGTSAFSWLSKNPGGYIGLYAKGGVANEPSIFGEAGPEAAVPLPDGRSIPVTLRMPPASNYTSGPQQVQVSVVSRMEKNGNLETYVEGISTKTATPIARQTAGGMLSSYSYGQKNGGAVQDQRHYQRLKRRA